MRLGDPYVSKCADSLAPTVCEGEPKVERRLLLVVLTLALLCAGPQAGAADTGATPGSVNELLHAYGIEGSPADYVVVVDTSSSMMDPPALYRPVVRAYKQFVSAIGDKDQLSVITFDETPDLRFSGDLSTRAKRVTAAGALPAKADGVATDIGAALSAVLERLERPGSNEVQTVIFLTDGRIHAPGSPYASPSSPAWKALQRRASHVTSGHRLSVYGAGLGSKATDVGSLKRVFPGTQVNSLPPNQLPSFFKEAIQQARVERLYTPVSNELEEGFVSVALSPGRLNDPTALTVRLRSHYPHLGARVILKSVSVTTIDGKQIRARIVGGPRTLELGPNGVSEPVRVEAHPSLAAEPKIGTETQSAQFVVHVGADIMAEPSGVIATSLGIKAAGRLVQADSVSARRTVGTPIWRFLVALVLLILLLLSLLWVYRRFIRTPPLPGGVLLESGVFEPFHGAATSLPNKDVVIPSTDGSVVEFFTKRGKFRKRTPRVYVRRQEGTSRVQSYGVERPLHTEEQVMTTDLVIVGRARLRVSPRGR